MAWVRKPGGEGKVCACMLWERSVCLCGVGEEWQIEKNERRVPIDEYSAAPWKDLVMDFVFDLLYTIERIEGS